MSLGEAISERARRAPDTLAAAMRRALGKLAAYFAERDPTVRAAFGPALAVATVLFLRSPLSNYIFDEQEALLANPFVNGKVPFRDVLTRDFWGLPHDRSIGSYRPLPNVVWRAVWQLGTPFHHPWALHWINILVHAVNAACVARIAFGLTRDRRVGWYAGGAFVTCAVLTEAVTGVVGIADVFGALGLLLALLALEAPLFAMGPLVFSALTVGFFSKESTLVSLPIVSWAALVAAPVHHPRRPLGALRALVALVAAIGALVLYTETRRRFFPTDPSPELSLKLPSNAFVQRGFQAFLRWFEQPRLPQDPINNPLALADLPHRIAGALGVYASGVGQALFPTVLSGDYSFSAEPIPDRLVSVRSILGAVLLVVPPIAGVVLFVVTSITGGHQSSFRTRLFVLFAIALVWVPVAYFPHSNIPIVLPTVRAERFWYLPAAGLTMLVGAALSALSRTPRLFGVSHAGTATVALFMVFQAGRARMHALDYADDLVFWRATARAVPASAKAHLNYGVMLGARNQLEARLVENRRAMELAPTWPMAHVYYADTLCRLGHAEQAWPYYRDGMNMAPNDRNLIALALQCLWDHGAIKDRKDELLGMADRKPGTWLAYLNRDIAWNGEKNNGVDRKYRPRGYDEGPAD